MIYDISFDLMIFDLGWPVKVRCCYMYVVIWICVTNEQIWLPGNYGSDFEQYLTWPNFTFGQLFTWIGTYNDHKWLSMG